MRWRYFILWSLSFLFLSSVVYAQKIYLDDGRVIEGTIIEQDQERVRIQVRGITLTYYLDEISRIEGYESPLESIAKDPSSALPQKVQEEKPTQLYEIPIEPPLGPRLAQMDKRELILKYMQVSGVQGQMRKTFAEIIQTAPADERRHLHRVLNVEDILEELVPIYSRYFTDSDLRELIQFYESSLGQKLMKTAPLILQETMEKSLEYFERRME